MNVPLQPSSHMDELRRQQLDALAEAKTGVGGIRWEEPKPQPEPVGKVAILPPYARMSVAPCSCGAVVSLQATKVCQRHYEDLLRDAPREMLGMLRGIIAQLEFDVEPSPENIGGALVLCSGQCGRVEEYNKLVMCSVCYGRFCAECYGLHKCKGD